MQPEKRVSQDCIAEYRLNRYLHRLDGPAIEYPNKLSSWWVNGVSLEFREHSFREYKPILSLINYMRIKHAT